MKAGIIAAGEGSRLKSEGLVLPKPLVPVGNVPLIERLLRSFIRHGLTEAVCIVNEQSLEVKRFVEGLNLSIPVRWVVQTTPSSMHSLFAIAPHLMGHQFLLSTVDSVFDDEEFSRFLEHARRGSNLDGVIATTAFVDDESPLYVRLDESRRIIGFSKSDAAPLVTGGLYCLSPRIFAEREVVLRQGIGRLRNFLGHLVDRGYRFEAFEFSKIVDVDHVRDIQTAESLLRGNA